MPRLQCAGLKKVYGGRTVVNDVSFHVERGEIVGLLGPNGAGKTTSFRMTCGMITPTAGKILLDEPFTGIDPVTIQGIQEIIKNLKDRGIGILLTDHREMETLTITDRNYIICEGRVLVSGDSKTVLSNEDAQRAYFGKRSYHAAGMLGGDQLVA